MYVYRRLRRSRLKCQRKPRRDHTRCGQLATSMQIYMCISSCASIYIYLYLGLTLAYTSLSLSLSLSLSVHIYIYIHDLY